MLTPRAPATCWTEGGRVLELRELPGVHGRRAEVAGLARLDDVVQRFHGLLDRGFRIEAMDLVQVDVVGAEPGQRSIDLLEHRLAGQPLTAGTVVHLAEYLGREHDVLPAGVTLDGTPDQFLRGAELVRIGRDFPTEGRFPSAGPQPARART
jgi:hypothetical protein